MAESSVQASPVQKSKVEKELIKGIVHLARHKEFYGHIVQQLQKVFVDGKHSIKTAAVGRIKGERFIKMYLNQEFFGEMLEKGGRDKGWKQMLSVLEHEILHCFPAGTMVSGSFMPIEKIKKDGVIIGSDGCEHFAEQVQSRMYSGGLVSIKPTGILGFDVTDGHRILVADIGWKTINTEIPRRNIRLIKDVSWKNSEDVKKGDWLAVPRMKGVRSDDYIDVSAHIRGNRWSLPEGVRGGKLVLNEDTAWLMGYYCAEGSASSNNPRGSLTRGSGQVLFSMHEKEEASHGAKVSEIVNRWVLGGKTFFQNNHGKGIKAGFTSTVMARVFHDKVGRGAANKCVPEEIFWHKDDRIVRSFLRGYFDGDGAVSSKSFSAATVSKKLALQVQMMAARLGVWLNVHLDELSKNPPKVIVSGKPRMVKDQYRMHCGGDDVRLILGYNVVEAKGRSTKHHVVVDEYVFVRIRSVSRKEWKGMVYNLRSPTRDYLVNNIVVHNCIFGHLFVRFQDTTRGNVAVDCVVNSVLPKENLPGDYVHPEKYGFELNKSAMWYYTHLADNPQYKKQCASGAFGEGGVMSHIMSSHGMWEDVKEDLIAKEFAKDIIRKAKDLCGKNYGDIPGEVIAQIDELLKREKAIIPWGRVLRMFVASCAESVLDHTVKRISRRFGTRPGTRKGDVLKLAVAVDTSGSISDDQLKIFFNEIRWIWNSD